MNKKALFKAVTLIAFSVSIIGCNFSERRAIEAVKNGTLGGHEQTTIGKAFESVLGNARWEYFETDKGVRVVELKGLPGPQLLPVRLFKLFCFNKSQYEMKIQFTLHVADDLFEIAYCGFGGDNAIDCDDFIEYAYGNNSSYEPVSCDAFGTFTDSRDGRTYNTVEIGNQVWMEENLNYESEDSFCYGDNVENCSTYGRLYTWNAAMNACPEGWHLPSRDEFSALIRTFGYEALSWELRSAEWSIPRWDGKGYEKGIDSYGFSALPAGFRKPNGFFLGLGDDANFWSATDESYEGPYLLKLGYDHPQVRRFCESYVELRNLDNEGLDVRSAGASVRCVQDSE